MGAIARALEKNHGSIHYAASLHGGIPPAERHRSRLALSLPEREEVSRGIAAGHSSRHIASTIERAPSTISREIARAHFADRERLFRSIVNVHSGDGERSGATPVSR